MRSSKDLCPFYINITGFSSLIHGSWLILNSKLGVLVHLCPVVVKMSSVFTPGPFYVVTGLQWIKQLSSQPKLGTSRLKSRSREFMVWVWSYVNFPWNFFNLVVYGSVSFHNSSRLVSQRVIDPGGVGKFLVPHVVGVHVKWTFTRHFHFMCFLNQCRTFVTFYRVTSNT